MPKNVSMFAGLYSVEANPHLSIQLKMIVFVLRLKYVFDS